MAIGSDAGTSSPEIDVTSPPPVGPPRHARRALAVLAVVAIGGVAAVRVLGPGTPERRDERAGPVGRPGLNAPIDGGLAPAVRETQPAGASGVGAGSISPGPTGAAAPAGTRAAPGTSVQAAIDAAGPGGVVVIGAGVHRDQFDLRPRDGQLIVGEPGAVLNGSRLVAGFTASGPRWVAGGQPTAVPSTGGAPCLPGFVRCGSPDDLFVDSRPLKRVGSAGEVVAGTWFYDYAAGQVWVGDDPNGRTVEVSVPSRHAIVADLGRGGQGVTVRNLTIEKYGAPFQECAIQTTDAGGGYANVADPNNGASGGWLIQNNTIRLNHGCSVFAGPGTVVADNRLVENGQIGVKGAGRRVQIVRNEVSRNNFAGHDTYYEAGGAKFWNAIDLTFAYNQVDANVGAGVWPDYALTGIVIDHNTITNNTEGGVWAEMTLSGAITYNDLSGNDAANAGNTGRTHGGIFLFNASNFDVAGNRLRDNNGGIVAQVQQRGCIAPNIVQGQGACPPGSTLGTLQGTRIHDNQIHMTRGITGLLVLANSGIAPYPQVTAAWAQAQFSTIRFDYNVYSGTGFDSKRGSNGNQFDDESNRFVWGFPSGYSANPAIVWAWTDRRFLGFADWQAFAGQDANGALRAS